MRGLGGAVFPCLERIAAVAKSAYARPGERPSPRDHLRSMALEPSVVTHSRITVVDDFVTKGASLLAAASLVKAAFPEAEVMAFALIRTMGLVPEVEQIIAPCVGKIRLRGNEAFRDP
jgi:hypoxanthine phosphoribosyltransferase